MKKFIFILFMMLISTMSVSAVFTETFLSNKCLNYYSKTEINYIISQSDPNDLDLSCNDGNIYNEKLYNINIFSNVGTISPKNFTNILSVPTYQQINSYYCGYASTKEVLQYINDESMSQSQYASMMVTASTSAVVYKVRNLINSYISEPKYSYTLGTAYTSATFQTLVTNNVTNNRPIIMHAIANSLPLYNGASSNVYHYYVVNGHTVSATFPFTIYYVDSWNHNYGSGNTIGQQTASLSETLATVQVTGHARYIIHT